MVHPTRFESVTFAFGAQRSIELKKFYASGIRFRTIFKKDSDLNSELRSKFHNVSYANPYGESEVILIAKNLAGDAALQA